MRDICCIIVTSFESLQMFFIMRVWAYNTPSLKKCLITPEGVSSAKEKGSCSHFVFTLGIKACWHHNLCQARRSWHRHKMRGFAKLGRATPCHKPCAATTERATETTCTLLTQPTLHVRRCTIAAQHVSPVTNTAQATLST